MTSGIPPTLLDKLQNTLLDCGQFNSLDELRPTFLDKRIGLWRNKLPDANSPEARVKATINFLYFEQDPQGQNGLVLFLAVLIDRADPRGHCKGDLQDLFSQLTVFPQPTRWQRWWHKYQLQGLNAFMLPLSIVTLIGIVTIILLLQPSLPSLFFGKSYKINQSGFNAISTLRGWEISSLAETGNERLWFSASPVSQNTQSLYWLPISNNTLEARDVTPKTTAVNNFDDPVRQLGVDCKGNLWILFAPSTASGPGVLVYQPKTEIFTTEINPITTDSWMPKYTMFAFAARQDCLNGRADIWLSRDENIYPISYTSSYPLNYSKGIPQTPVNVSDQPIQSIRDMLFEPSLQLLWVVDLFGDVIPIEQGSIRERPQVIKDVLWSIDFDEENSIWVLGNETLSKIGDEKLHLLSSINGQPVDLAIGAKWFWLALNCSNIDCPPLIAINKISGEFVEIYLAIEPPTEAIDGDPEKLVNDLLIVDNTLWIATDSGLFFYNDP